MNAEDILKSFFGGSNAGPFGSAGSNFTSGGFQEAAQVVYTSSILCYYDNRGRLHFRCNGRLEIFEGLGGNTLNRYRT
jgi:hypothetical protein